MRNFRFKELLVRWYQMAVFSAVLRMHGDRGPYNIPPLDERNWGGGYLHTGQPNELWSYGEEVYQILRKYYDIRISMHDYIKSLFTEASENGSPLIRPLFYEFPEEKACWDIQDEYMFGSRYLIAPILSLHTYERQIFLPSGRWKQLGTEAVFEGNTFITVPAPLDTIPVFERLQKD